MRAITRLGKTSTWLLVPIHLVVLACAGLGGPFPAAAATFGKVVPIGGHISDLVFDGRRGVVYIANFGAKRVDVLSASDSKLLDPIPVPATPSSLDVSPDGRYLTVGHFSGDVTIIDLDGGVRRTIAVGDPMANKVLTIAYGNSPRALVVSTEGIWLLDPADGSLENLDFEFRAEDLPVPFATFPPDIIQASAGISGDKNVIYVIAELGGGGGEGGGGRATAIIHYDVAEGQLSVLGITSTPDLGPRVVSVNDNGSRFLAGWALLDPQLVLWAQFPRATGEFELGGHAWDYTRNLIYAQVPPEIEGGDGDQQGEEEESRQAGPGPEGPVLEIFDTDNLTVRERIRLPENLAGKLVFSDDMETLYGASDSGVLVLPVGSLFQTPRVVAVQEDLLFQASPCDNRLVTRVLDIVDPGGGSTDFAITGAINGVRVTPSSGRTPAQVTVTVDPTVFRDRKGTTVAELQILSSAAVNIPPPVRLLINTRDPEQRGTIINVPGKLVDILPDPSRNWFYVLRQDKNQMIVFDGSTFEQVRVYRTGNTPLQMALTRDGRYMIVTNDNSGIANVYDLDAGEPSQPIIFPLGHYPRSIAVSGASILAAVRTASATHVIDLVNFEARMASTPPSLGIYKNEIDPDMALIASPAGDVIFGAMANGTVILYEIFADTVVASRQDFDSLGGPYTSVSRDLFLAGTHVLNRSLVPAGTIQAGPATSSGFAFVEGFGILTAAGASTAPGLIQRMDLDTLNPINPTRTVEAPLVVDTMVTPPVGQIGQTILSFTRTLAPLANRGWMMSLSLSGLTALPWEFDAAVAEPVITQVVNSADGAEAIAPGSLITIRGRNFTTVSEVAGPPPLPTFLGGACVTVNANTLVPMIRISPTEIGAQLPYGLGAGASMIVRGPGGTSRPFSLSVLAGAPAVFRDGQAGPQTGLATVVRAKNNQLATLANPLHPEEVVIIYLTGLGETSPRVTAGHPAPAEPLATVIAQPEVTLGGVGLPIEFAGLVPGQVGVYQINARIPFWVPTGMSVPLTITQAGHSTTISVRVVN